MQQGLDEGSKGAPGRGTTRDGRCDSALCVFSSTCVHALGASSDRTTCVLVAGKFVQVDAEGRVWT